MWRKAVIKFEVYPGICRKWLRETTNTCQVIRWRALKPEPSKYKAEVLTTW